MPRRTGSPGRFGRLLVLVGLLAGLTGCAYYNTFYLARKYYTQGEVEQRKDTTGRLSPTAADRWDKSIKQAQKVLQRYPKSKWIDDALFLIGKGYFGREEYGSARQYFQQLLDNYPQSEFALESRFWMARTWAAESDYARASDAFKEIMAAGPPAEWADQVLFAQGEVEFARENYSGAVEHYRELVSRYPNGSRAFDALMRTGDASFERRQWVDAQKAYTSAMPRARESKDRLDLRLKSGQCLEKQEKYDEALDLYRQTALELVPLGKYNQIIADPMAGVTVNPNVDPNDPTKSGSNNPDDPGYNPGANPNNTNPDPSQPLNPNFGGSQSQAQYQQSGDANRRAASDAIQQNPLAAQLPRILLRQGLCLSARGDQKGAISTFRAIVTAFRGTAEASEAQYRIGYINEVELQDYTSARKAYDDVKSQGQSLFGEQATKRSGNLARLIALAAADTVKGAKATKKSLEAEAERAFLGAELFMFQQDKPDKALEQYATVEADFPKSSFAPRAALARAWILTNAMGDTTGGAQAYRDIIEKYPGSDAWRMAYQLVNGEPPKEAVRAVPPADSTLAAAGADSAGADSTGADSTGARGALTTLALAPSPEVPTTSLPTLTSALSPADSAARSGLTAAPLVPGGPVPTGPASVSGPGGVPMIAAVQSDPAAAAAGAQTTLAPPTDPAAMPPLTLPAAPTAPTPSTTAAAPGTAAAITPPAITPSAITPPVIAPSDLSTQNAITPGTPHRQPSRVAKGDAAGAMPLAWVEWQRWLKSPASRRVIPAPVGGTPRPSSRGGTGGSSEKVAPADGTAPVSAPTGGAGAPPGGTSPTVSKKLPPRAKPDPVPKSGGGGH